MQSVNTRNSAHDHKVNECLIFGQIVTVKDFFTDAVLCCHVTSLEVQNFFYLIIAFLQSTQDT
jgi:hypothetical protein